MLPDLEKFENMSFTAIIRALRDDGYDIIGDGLDSVVLAPESYDGETPYVVRVSNFVTQAETFAALCRENEDNPHFPSIYDSHYSAGDPPVFITVMERLQTLDDLPDMQRKVLGGFARAFALLVDGEESHDDAHRQMLKKPEVAQAAFAILDAMENMLDAEGDVLLYHDSGYCADAPGTLDEWYPDNVLFRGRELVFTDPFREMLASREKCAELETAFAHMRTRLEDMSGRTENHDVKNKGPDSAPGPSL